MVEVCIFTNKSKKDCADHIITTIKQWLNEYLDIDDYEESDLKDLLALHMVGAVNNGWHCEFISLHPEFLIDRLIDEWDWKKEQLLLVREYLHQLLELLEDGASYHVFKFDDEYEKALNQIFYTQIYEIEQMIRSTLTAIFYPKHPNDIYKILELNSATPQGYDMDTVRKHENGFQNEFFHLDIGSYQNLSNYRLISKDGLAKASEQYTDLSTFIEDIKNYGFLSEEESGLIFSVGDNLKIIKDFRNCIMHSRAYSPDDIDSFDKARNKLNKLLLDFQNSDGREIKTA